MSLLRTQDTAFQKCSFTCHYVCACEQALQHKMPLKKSESHSAEKLFVFSPRSIIRAAPLQAEHRNHKWHWSTAISHFLSLRMETGTPRPRSPGTGTWVLLVWINEYINCIKAPAFHKQCKLGIKITRALLNYTVTQRNRLSCPWRFTSINHMVDFFFFLLLSIPCQSLRIKRKDGAEMEISFAER